LSSYGGRIFEVVPDDTKKYTPLVDMSKDVSKQECKITHASETSDGGILFAARWSEKLPTGEKVYNLTMLNFSLCLVFGVGPSGDCASREFG
jgi:hypothetical protein